MSEKKEPPSDDRFVLISSGGVSICGRRSTAGDYWQDVSGFPIVDVVDWCEIPAWPDLVAAPGAAARLADAQARLDKAQARMLELEMERNEANERFRQSCIESKETALKWQAVVGRAETERDNAKARLSGCEAALTRARNSLDALECAYANSDSERDQAICERDAAIARADGLKEELNLCVDRLNAELSAPPLVEVCPHCGPGTDLNTALNELADTRCELMGARERAERAEAQRDEVGCQLEALRAVQRDDLQVLTARIALVEADVAGLKGEKSKEDTDAEGD